MKQQVDERGLNSPKEDAVSEQQIQSDVNRVLTFVGVLLLGFHVSWTVFPPDPIGLALQLLFIALLVLALKRWTAAMVLALVQIPLFLTTSARWNTVPTVDEVLIAFQLVLMLALISRLHSPAGASSSILKTLKLVLGRREQKVQQREQNLRVFSQAVRHFLFSTLSLVGAMLAVTLLAAFILQLVPMDPEFRAYSRRWFRILPTGFRLIMLGGLLFICVLVSWVVVAEVNFRRLSVREASMYLRSQLVGWLHRDFRMVVRRHRRQKRKRS